MNILVMGVNSPDYLQDDIYHGLKTLDDVNVESNVSLSYLYDDYDGDITKLYGRGMSYARNIPSRKRHVVSSYEIYGKLAAHYYDGVIFLSWRRRRDMYDHIALVMPKHRIALIDGEDDTDLAYIPGHLNFKRELICAGQKDLLPVSFAIPAEKLVVGLPEKSRIVSTEIPRSDRSYAFSNEGEYYGEYQASRFAITHKRAGWDCKRHYEILANRCIPIFRDLDACPEYTLTTLPKKLLINMRDHWKNVGDDEYQYWQNELFAWCGSHLTTMTLARYILGKLCG